MDARCRALKGDGLQCTRKAVGVHPYCTQHQKSKNTTSIDNQEPWARLALVAPRAENGKRALQKIRTLLNKKPAKNDGAGYIYVYCLRHERDLHYYKIGRTSRAVEVRIKEWAADTPGIELVKCYHVSVGHCRLESLVHAYLHYCRIYRTPYGERPKKMHSVWASDQSTVIDDGQQLDEKQAQAHTLVARSKQVEWFCEELRVIKRVIKSLLVA